MTVISYHSCHVGTPSTPPFKSCQLVSNCFAAWLKYRPSVDSAALLREMIAVPAEPENPEMNSMEMLAIGAGKPTEGGGGRGAIIDLGGHHMARCTRTGGYLLRAQLYEAGKHNSRFKQPAGTHR